MQFLRELLFPGGFMPHGYCYLWHPDLVGLHVVSDALIAPSYFSYALGQYWLCLNLAPSRERWHAGARG